MRAVAVAVVIAALASCAPAVGPGGPTQPLEPLVVGAEQHLTIEWERTPRGGDAVIWGYVSNPSPYTFDRMRILVDALDGSGNVLAQRLSWVPGLLGSWGRSYFEVAMPPAENYRVRIFSYDRVERGPRNGFRF